MRGKPLPITEGVGELRFVGFAGPVSYSIQGEPQKLKLGPARVRGSVTASVQVAQDAFRAGDGVLVLAGGEQYRITMQGHTAGGDQVFVELRI